MRTQSVEAEGLSGVKRNRMDRWKERPSRGVYFILFFYFSPATHQLAARYRRSLIPSR